MSLACLYSLSGVGQRGSAVLSGPRRGEGQPAETLLLIQEVGASGRGRRPWRRVRLAGPGPREEQAEGQTVRHPSGPGRAEGIAAETRRHPRGRFVRGRDGRGLRGQPGRTQGADLHPSSPAQAHHCENGPRRHPAVPLPLPLHPSCHVLPHGTLAGRPARSLAHPRLRHRGEARTERLCSGSKRRKVVLCRRRQHKTRQEDSGAEQYHQTHSGPPSLLHPRQCIHLSQQGHFPQAESATRLKDSQGEDRTIRAQGRGPNPGHP